MRSRHVFLVSSILATLLFQMNHPVHSFAGSYVYMTYEDLVILPAHLLFFLPYVLLALASSERAISLLENRVLIQSRLSGRKEYADQVMKVLLKDMVVYGTLHVSVIFVLSIVTRSFSLGVFELQVFIRTIILHASMQVLLLVLSTLMQRSTALMTWFAVMAAISSAGLMELHRLMPFFYRFNLFVSCMMVDDRIYAGWLAIVLWTIALVVMLFIARVSIMKGESHD